MVFVKDRPNGWVSDDTGKLVGVEVQAGHMIDFYSLHFAQDMRAWTTTAIWSVSPSELGRPRRVDSETAVEANLGDLI